MSAIKTRLLAAGVVALTLGGADTASAFISANTIDDHATYKQRRQAGAGDRTDRVHARRARRHQGRRPPAGDRGPRPEPVEGPVHGRGPALAGQGARSRRRPASRTAAAGSARSRPREAALASPTGGDGASRVQVAATLVRGGTTVAQDVCFTVNNPGDPIPSTVRGTLFRSTRMFRSRSTALLLQHGAVAERSAWSGGAPVIDGTHDMARSLANAGYEVFAIDRLGYGESPYERPPGSGLLLTPDGYIEMTHQMVTQIRAGSHTDCAGKAAGRRAARVVAVRLQLRSRDRRGLRHSPPRHRRDHPDVLVEPAATVGGLPELVGVLAPQLAAGKDYVEFFLDGADGYSEFCERLPVLPPGNERPTRSSSSAGPTTTPDRLPDAERRGRRGRLSRRTRPRRSGTSVPPPCCSCSPTGTRPSRAPTTTARIPTS